MARDRITLLADYLESASRDAPRSYDAAARARWTVEALAPTRRLQRADPSDVAGAIVEFAARLGLGN